MTEEPYQNREIREMFSEVREALDRIELQTTKTNGRVSILERWQSYVLGFCAALMLVFLSIIPLMLSLLKNA